MNGLQPNLVDLIHIFLYVISFKKKLAILLSNEDGKKNISIDFDHDDYDNDDDYYYYYVTWLMILLLIKSNIS